MKSFSILSIGLIVGFGAAESAFAQRGASGGGGGGGNCNRNQNSSTSSNYTNTMSPLASQYSPQSYLAQRNYQQQQFMQQAYVQQLYMQQQQAMLQAIAENQRQAQIREEERLASLRKAAELRRSTDEKKRAVRAEKLAAAKAKKEA